MWMEKLYDGVLRVMTPIGPRYIQPSLSKRIYLMWIFRHFHSLPQQVLSPWQQQLIDRLWAEHRFVSLPPGMEDAPILGTVENRLPISAETLPPRRSSASVGDAAMAPLVADVRQRS
jgi:hypothetical protein